MNLVTDLPHSNKCRIGNALSDDLAPATDCSCGAILNFMDIPQRLYSSEINFSVSCFWDGRFDVKLGDDMNGFKAEANLDTYVEVLAWLDKEARLKYPNSFYATGKYPAAARL